MSKLRKLKAKPLPFKAKAKGVQCQGYGQAFSRPRPQIFVLKVSSKLRTVPEETITLSLSPSGWKSLG